MGYAGYNIIFTPLPTASLPATLYIALTQVLENTEPTRNHLLNACGKGTLVWNRSLFWDNT